jgi:3',5'-cyclic AMP phosphodiesterase CpdA
MPIHLPPISRRQFLAGSLAAGAGLLLPGGVYAAAAAADPNRWALLADTHIWERRDGLYRDVKPAENLAQARREILALDPPPAAAIVAGDTAFLQGHPGDYAVLLDLVKPIRTAGVPVHLALGNHDDRDNFRKAIAGTEPKTTPSPVDGKCVAVLETPRANWFLLDSLDKTGEPKGLLGDVQLQWLGKSLDARTDKPALVLAHHNPDRLINVHGLKDTARLFDVLVPRRHVKAYFYGHTHRWQIGRESKIHLVNVPTTAWLFEPGEPRGLLTAQIRPDGATITLHSLDHRHAKHGQKVELPWRS